VRIPGFLDTSPFLPVPVCLPCQCRYSFPLRPRPRAHSLHVESSLIQCALLQLFCACLFALVQAVEAVEAWLQPRLQLTTNESYRSGHPRKNIMQARSSGPPKQAPAPRPAIGPRPHAPAPVHHAAANVRRCSLTSSARYAGCGMLLWMMPAWHWMIFQRRRQMPCPTARR
jgi:hypothetical protein